VPMLGSPLPISAFAIRLSQCGMAMLAVLCLFMSLLLQARHAIYVTVEPPSERSFWVVSLWRRYRRKRDGNDKSASAVKETVAKASRPRRRKPNDDSGKPSETLMQDVQPRAEEISPPAQRAKQSARVERRTMRRSA
jgi:hypothetical protein